jgi:hypothetical protein
MIEPIFAVFHSTMTGSKSRWAFLLSLFRVIFPFIDHFYFSSASLRLFAVFIVLHDRDFYSPSFLFFEICTLIQHLYSYSASLLLSNVIGMMLFVLIFSCTGQFRFFYWNSLGNLKLQVTKEKVMTGENERRKRG